MDSFIDWSKINYYQFEELSLDFIQKEYPHFDWIPTKKVNDGNKDICSSKSIKRLTTTYIEEYWVEAKYKSDINSTLSKGQLDPTIVSGIISNNVKCIAFITNAQFTESYLNRAKKAFIQNNNGNEILFIDNTYLENWLYQNKKIYKKYFNSNIKSATDSKILNIKKIFFLSVSNEINNIFSPTQTLEVDKNYILYVFINSNKGNQKIELHLDNSIFYIIKQYDNVLNLGLNCIKLLVSPKIIWNKEIEIIIQVDDNSINYKLDKNKIIESNYIRIICSNQLEKKAKIEENIKLSGTYNVIICLFAEAGYGKTYLLEEIQNCYSFENEVLNIKFENTRNNYSLFCKILIFLNFGNYYEENDNLIFNNLELLPKNISEKLYNGLTNIEDAIYILDKILTNNTNILKRTFNNKFKLLLLDDIYKLDEKGWEFLEYLLNEIKNTDINIKVICSNRESESTIERKDFLLNCSTYTYNLNLVSSNDVISTIESNIPNINMKYFDISILDDYPVNIFFLQIFVQKLINANILNTKGIDSINLFNRLYNEVSRSEQIYLKELLKKSKNIILDIIYIYEIGIEERFLYDFFGKEYDVESELERLKRLNLIKLKSINFEIVPFHDIYLESYKKYINKNYNTAEIISFFRFLLNNNYNKIETLSILLKIDKGYRNDYLNELIIYRDNFYKNKNYPATVMLSETIIQVYEEFQNKSDYHILESYFKYADSLNHCRNIIDSKNYFEFVKTFGKNSSDLNIKELVYSAKSEIINLEYWQLQIDDHTINSIISFITELKFYIENITIHSSYIIHAYLTSINRLMTNYLLLDNYTKAEEVFTNLINESDKYLSLENKGYAFMDYAKGLYIHNIFKAYRYLKKAKQIFKSLGTENRRLLDCEMEILYIQALKSRQILNQLISKSTELLDNGYIPIYTKSLLKIATVNILNKNYKNAIENINLIFKFTKSVENKRINLLITNLYSAIEHLQNNYHEKNSWLEQNIKLTENLGIFYRKIPLINKRITSSISISINIEDKNSFLIDPRMW